MDLGLNGRSDLTFLEDACGLACREDALDVDADGAPGGVPAADHREPQALPPGALLEHQALDAEALTVPPLARQGAELGAVQILGWSLLGGSDGPNRERCAAYLLPLLLPPRPPCARPPPRRLPEVYFPPGQ